MKKLAIVLLLLTLLSACVPEDTDADIPYNLLDSLEANNYHLELGFNHEMIYETERNQLILEYAEKNIHLIDYYTIFDENNQRIGYLYTLNESDSSLLLFDSLSIESYLDLNIWFVYRIESYVLYMNHEFNSSFPDVFEEEHFDYNYQYDYHYLGGEHPFLEELRYQAVHISYYLEQGMTYQETLNHYENTAFYQYVSFKGVHAFSHLIGFKYYDGIIYETSDTAYASIVFQELANINQAVSHKSDIYRYQNLVFRSFDGSDTFSVFFGSKSFEHNSIE